MFRDLGTNILIKAMIIKGNHDLNRLHKSTINARKNNEKLLFKIIKAGQNSEFGKKHNFSKIKTVEDFRRNVPLSTYEDYEPYIERMINNNEEDILTSFPLVGYAQTSGSTGKPKFIPLTKQTTNAYKNNTLTMMMAMTDKYCREKYGQGLKPGRGMFICLDFDDNLPNGRSASNVPETTSKQLGFLFPYLTNPPFKHLFKIKDVSTFYLINRFALEDKNTMFIFSIFFSSVYEILTYMKTHWEALVEDIEKGTINDIARPVPSVREEVEKVIKPNPERAAELRKEFEKGVDETFLNRLWPNLSVIYGIATSVYTPYTRSVREMAGDIPFDHSIYGASEGLIGTVDHLNDERRLLVLDSCYFEFIDIENDNNILSLDELEVGKEYEIVLTNQAGLYRYHMGDIVRVDSYLNDCPYLVFSHRKGHLISITGEKTSEEHLEDVVKKIEEESKTKIDDWSVYVRSGTGHKSVYALLLENSDGKDLSKYSEMADEYLRKVNKIYDRFRKTGPIAPLKIENQEPGAHKAWRDYKVSQGVSSIQVKPVRVLDNDEKLDFFTSRIVEKTEEQ